MAPVAAQAIHGTRRILSWVDGSLRPQEQQLSMPILIMVLVTAGAAYGAVMGTFAMTAGYHSFAQQWPQMLCSAVKVPCLLFLAMLIGLPSFFVFNTLAGLREDFPQVMSALIRAQAGMALVLCAFAPVTLFVYLSLPPNSNEYVYAVLINALTFTIASIAVQFHISQSYAPLVAKHPRHLWLKRSWLFLYAFIGIQLGWNLRPFIGAPNVPFSVFREGGWENAYIKVGEILMRALVL